YVGKPLPETAGDARDIDRFDVGANLYLRDRASASAADRNLTGDILGELGDVADIDVSWDGRKVVFAMRGPMLENVAPEDQPTWNIWEYDLDADALRRIIASDIVAEEGHDRFPHYLPDGRIVFASTRQRQSRAILLDEGKPQFAALTETRGQEAFVLHVIDEDGSGLRQISFNQSHDRDPFVLPDGRIGFTRWDNALGTNEMNLYRMRPDGADLELLYGAESHGTGTDGATIQFLSPQPMPSGRVLAVARPFADTEDGGDLIEIDVEQYVENTQPLRSNVGILSGPAQTRLLPTDVRTVEGPSPGGRYASAYPLWDGTGRFLVSWTQCRLVEIDRIVPCTEERLAAPDLVPAPALYGIFIYDPANETQQPIVNPREGFFFSEAVAAEPRTLPPVILDGVAGVDLERELVDANTGVLHIESVYDFDGVDTTPDGIEVMRDPALTPPDERPARFLRLEKAVSQPDDDVFDVPGFAFGPRRGLGMREILGYAPVEPDGSIKIEVPANVALSFSVLDANGRRIGPRHATWLQMRPGEVRECQGCHDPGSDLSHGRADLFDGVNPCAPSTGVPFPNTDPALFADFGETMAETRTRISCSVDCAARKPAVDVIYDDVWTYEPTAGRPAAASFAFRYSDLRTPVPVAPACQTQWSAGCRIVINYLEHIQPIWELQRQVIDADGVTVLADNTCVACHIAPDALDLTTAASALDANRVTSYMGLLFDLTGNAGGLDGGVPTSPLIAGNALASSRFFERFAPGGTHAGFLSEAELRLITEWVDIGAQYYNNPFAAPAN
ncbi:MAG TPA: hypothetical protein VLT59_07615, partial [Steroidobacteraceae bacterium]|nr:hypothetical protein [Steroidobacteraceae bacterium]